MDWQMVGVGVTSAAALLGANAWLMKLVIDSAITKSQLNIQREFVTKEACKAIRSDAQANATR